MAFDPSIELEIRNANAISLGVSRWLAAPEDAIFDQEEYNFVMEEMDNAQRKGE